MKVHELDNDLEPELLGGFNRNSTDFGGTFDAVDWPSQLNIPNGNKNLAFLAKFADFKENQRRRKAKKQDAKKKECEID